MARTNVTPIVYPGIKGGYQQTIAASFAAGANDLHGNRIYVGAKATVSKVSLLFAPTGVSAGAKIVVGIYDASGTAPGNKLVQSAEYTTTGNESGRIVFFDLQSSVELVPGNDYYIAYHSNTTFTYEQAWNFAAASAAVAGHVFRTVTYNATLPASFGAVSRSGGMMSMGVY